MIAEQRYRTVLDDDGETTLDYCNDCGILTYAENELCERCYQEQLDDERWDLLNPGARCPPRE